jgi:hypothetical protein
MFGGMQLGRKTRAGCTTNKKHLRRETSFVGERSLDSLRKSQVRQRCILPFASLAVAVVTTVKCECISHELQIQCASVLDRMVQ